VGHTPCIMTSRPNKNRFAAVKIAVSTGEDLLLKKSGNSLRWL